MERHNHSVVLCREVIVYFGEQPDPHQYVCGVLQVLLAYLGPGCQPGKLHHLFLIQDFHALGVDFSKGRGLCVYGWSDQQSGDRKKLAESHILILAEIHLPVATQLFSHSENLRLGRRARQRSVSDRLPTGETPAHPAAGGPA